MQYLCTYALRPKWLGLNALWLLWACGAAEGQLLVHVEPDDAGSNPPLKAAVRPNMSLQYQITGSLDVQTEAQVFVVDLFDTDAHQVGELHAVGRIVIGYVSVGTLEDWRADVARFPRAGIGSTLPAYSNEKWLDTRNIDVRKAMQARFDFAIKQGFDGLYASTLGAYRNSSGFPLTRADELDYLAFLSAAAHSRGLSIGLSGDFELSDQLDTSFDWAIAIGCLAQHSCAQLAPLQAHGLPVFDLETEGDHAAVCKEALSYALPVTFKDAKFGATRSVCP